MCQVQVARDVDKREGVGGKTNTLPEKVERKVVKAGRRADGCLIGSLIQTRIDGFLKLSDNVANKGITKKRKQGTLGEKLKPTSNKKMKNYFIATRKIILNLSSVYLRWGCYIFGIFSMDMFVLFWA